jgi:hypothetical protein
MPATRSSKSTPVSPRFVQAGWWIPGSLKSGWDNTYQQNFNDLATKMTQLELRSLISGVGAEPQLGFYFSQAQYDFLQILATGAAAGAGGGADSGPLPVQVAQIIVAYSIWFSSQGWGGFSPVPVVECVAPGVINEARPPRPMTDLQYPIGWYLLGTPMQAWFDNLAANFRKAQAKRQELEILDLSPFYLTQGAVYGCLQLVQPPLLPAAPRDGGIACDQDRLTAYLAWFAGQGFGNLGATPLMSTTLVSGAINLASKNP